VTRRPERRAAGEPRPARRAGSAPAKAGGGGKNVKRVGLYPGTFDPITNGHIDIIGRAVKLVDKLIIGIAINEGKGPLFTLEERVKMVMDETKALANGTEIEARPFDNLLMHFAEQCGAQTIIRGLRAVSDFEYEFQMVAMNQQMNDEIETVFLMADPHHQAVSSRLVKEIARLGGRADLFVPAAVNEKLAAKFGAKKGR
jgi:pantetheine-phosphate adenylyltransferase